MWQYQFEPSDEHSSGKLFCSLSSPAVINKRVHVPTRHSICCLDPENDVNPGDRGSEFTSGLVESCAVYFPETGEHPLSPKDVYGCIFGTIEEILIDVFTGATEKDAAHQHGYSTPQIWMQGLEKMPLEEGGHGGYQ